MSFGLLLMRYGSKGQKSRVEGIQIKNGLTLSIGLHPDHRSKLGVKEGRKVGIEGLSQCSRREYK